MTHPRFFRKTTGENAPMCVGEKKLWASVLTRALLDIARYHQDSNEYMHAFYWASVPGDENKVGTLAWICSALFNSESMAKQAIESVRDLAFASAEEINSKLPYLFRVYTHSNSRGQ